MKYTEVQRRIMHVALAIIAFCLGMAVNMSSPVFEARLFALLGVFLAGAVACYHICMMSIIVGEVRHE